MDEQGMYLYECVLCEQYILFETFRSEFSTVNENIFLQEIITVWGAMIPITHHAEFSMSHVYLNTLAHTCVYDRSLWFAHSF